MPERWSAFFEAADTIFAWLLQGRHSGAARQR
jgi:hypothetical protein